MSNPSAILLGAIFLSAFLMCWSLGYVMQEEIRSDEPILKNKALRITAAWWAMCAAGVFTAASFILSPETHRSDIGQYFMWAAFSSTLAGLWMVLSSVNKRYFQFAVGGSVLWAMFVIAWRALV